MFDSEKSLSKIEKKTDSLKVNDLNLLFDSVATIEKKLLDASLEFQKLSSNEVRDIEINLYYKFVSDVLKIKSGEISDKDPFTKITGVPISRFYKDKASIEYPVAKPEDHDRKMIFSPTTTLIRIENEQIEKNKDGSDREDKRTYIDYDDVAKSIFFDPIEINKDRGWNIKFGFLEFNTQSDDYRFMNGVFGLEKDVVRILKNSEEGEEISKKLNEILVWFNHDLVSHATFLPTRTDDTELLIRSNRKEAVDLNRSFGKEAKNIGDGQEFNTAFAGELWSLNLHQDIFQEIVKDRPAVMRFLRAHFDKYTRLVEDSAKKIKDSKLAEDYKEYMLKAYSFGFFRLVNPQIYTDSIEFADLHEKYPDVYDLGSAEDKVRKYAFGESGLSIDTEDGKEGRMPHKKIFEIFEESLKDNETLNKAKSYFEKNVPIPENVLENLKNIYKNYNDNQTRRELKFMIEGSIDLEQRVKDPIREEYVVLKNILAEHYEIVLDLILFQKVKKSDFVEEFLTQLSDAMDINIKA